ncbi:MAG: type IV pilus assembly protein PilM [Firmicutes bacterium]|nr:type IV pilus assembly protein PilM [Bacillota bacterium]
MALFKQSTAIGLEIDTEIIRVVELKGTPKNTVLTAIDQIQIPENAVTEGTVNDGSAVGLALEELWAKAGIRKRDVILGVLNQGVLMRMAKLPKIPEKKLSKAIRFQAEEYFPIPVAEMVLDYSFIGETKSNNGSEMELLLVAARREILNKSLKALSFGSISPLIIEPSNLATMHTLAEDQFSGNVVLLDISNGLSSLLLINDGVPRFSRVLPHSMKSYSEEKGLPQMDSPLAMASVAAAAEGREPNENKGDGDTLFHWGTALANDVRASISYYITQTRTGSVDKIFISGQGARLEGLPELIQEELEVPVNVVDPFAKLSKISGVPGINIEQEGTDFAVTVGLALRGLEAHS